MKTAVRIVLAVVLLAFFSSSHYPAGASLSQNANTPRFAISFTGTEEVVSFSSQLGWVPDGNISYFKSGSNINLWIQGIITGQVTGQSTYYFIGTDFSSLMPRQISGGLPVPVLTPSGAGFDKNYAGSTAVLKAANGNDLLMFYHGEDHTCTSLGHDRTKTGIGLARSSDNGATWSRLGQIISSPEMPTDCNYEGFKGAGNPSVVLSRDGQYFYMYFMEWVSNRPDSVSLARATVSSDGSPGVWFKYKNGDFSQPGLGGTSDAVILPSNQTAGYAGLPNVTFNSYLNLYVAIVMGHNGFYYASSHDGINWNSPKLFWEVPALTTWGTLQNGDSWFYYPTLISTDQDTDDITTHTAYLYYAHGIKPQPHYLARRPVKIGYEVYLPTIIRSGN